MMITTYNKSPRWRKRWNPYTGSAWRAAKEKNKKTPKIFQSLSIRLIKKFSPLEVIIANKSKKPFPKKGNEKLERIRALRRILKANYEILQQQQSDKIKKEQDDYRSFIDDLENSQDVRKFCENKDNAILLYRALCNNRIISMDNEKEVFISWRNAGSIVAELRDKGEDYLDFYLSGEEGRVDPSVEFLIYSIGWKIVGNTNLVD